MLDFELNNIFDANITKAELIWTLNFSFLTIYDNSTYIST